MTPPASSAAPASGEDSGVRATAAAYDRDGVAEQYRQAKAGAARFDGHFVVAVASTGIYCRPSCPAPAPHPRNIDFLTGAAAAQVMGYRACKRCRPDFSPATGEPFSDDSVVARALARIDAGALHYSGTPGLAVYLGVRPEALEAALRDRTGAGVAEHHFAVKVRTARMLLESSDLSLSRIATAAGFGSLEALEAALTRAYASDSVRLRSTAPKWVRGADPGVIRVELAVRKPFSFSELLDYHRARYLPAIEMVTDSTYSRTLATPSGSALATVFCHRDTLLADLELAEPADLPFVVSALRRQLDLDADPETIDAALSADPAVAALVAARPGLRSPGAADGFEIALRAVVGQQISVAAARTRLNRIAIDYGQRAFADETLRLFPTPHALAAAEPAALAMPKARAATMIELASRTAQGVIRFDGSADTGQLREQLLSIKGIGVWTADYIVMRMGDPDVLLATDLGVINAAAGHGVDLTDARPDLSPWRSYLTNHLWAATH